MSYTIEVYRGNQKAERHLGIYALYVMFYPQLVAGPIERPQHMLHQFRDYHSFSTQNLLDGLRLMLWGFFKKLVIADRLALYVNPVFNFPDNYHYLNLIIATLFFTIQIYCDFSGYSDIAIGSAKTMGFDLMTNFNRPYFSKNIHDFWKKWHISLSTWFRDYLYIPMGGNRTGTNKMYFNIIIVFLLSGLWHGASWTFIVWGALHALYMLVYLYIKNKQTTTPILKIINNLFTFCLVAFAWIFFRANSLHDASTIVKHILTLKHAQSFTFVVTDFSNLSEFGVVSSLIALIMITIMFIIEKIQSLDLTSLNKNPIADIIFCTLILCLTISLGIFHNNSFIYFQF